jgi:hypothetical protein
MVVNGWLVALHRAMARRGRTAEDTVQAAAVVADEFFRAMPRWLLSFIGWLAFTPPVRGVLRRAARRSQERRHPADFVFTFEKTKPDGWELRFTECAVNKFYDAQQVPELAPYCNFFDVAYSRLMGMGIDATETIGLGCSTCHLRYRHGRETIVPERLRDLLPDARSS